jgi:thiol-disulfide isomerase/thioredoxin
MKHTSRIFIAVLILLSPLHTFATGIDFHHDLTLQEALDKAKREGKLVFMDCYTSWCGPCKRLAASVFTDSAVGAYFNNNYINVKFDMEKGEGTSIATRFQITAYPTLLWLDGNGSIKNKVVGAPDIAGLLNDGRTSAPPIPDIMAGMDKKYADGVRDEAFIEEYLRLFNSSGRDYDAIFAEYLKLAAAQAWPKDKSLALTYDLTDRYPSPGIDMLVSHRNSLIAKYGAEAYTDKINKIANEALALAKAKTDLRILKDATGLVKGNIADSKQRVAWMEMDYYMNTSATAAYDKYVTSYIKKYGANDASELNDIAWQYYINTNDRKLLKKASEWAFKAVNIKNNCANNTTYAYLQYKLGNFSEATKACDYAIIKAKEENIKPVSALALKESITKEEVAKKAAPNQKM